MILDKNQSEADVAPSMMVVGSEAPSLDQGLQNALNSNADIAMKENPSYLKKYMKKHGGLMKKAAAAAVAGCPCCYTLTHARTSAQPSCARIRTYKEVPALSGMWLF
jgi:hypothetical protein